MRPPLDWVLKQLEAMYGRLEPPSRDVFELLVQENCAYLVDDQRRAAVFEALRREVGIDPAAIAAAPARVLLKILEPGGMLPAGRVEKLRACAALAIEIGLSRLREAVRDRPDEARKLLRKFPGIGAPGADKLLLLAGGHRELAPESNGLRVLNRLGFGEEHRDYARSYRSAIEAARPQLPRSAPAVVRLHLALRRHGQELCKRSRPVCEACPLRARCAWVARG